MTTAQKYYNCLFDNRLYCHSLLFPLNFQLSSPFVCGDIRNKVHTLFLCNIKCFIKIKAGNAEITDHNKPVQGYCAVAI